MLLRGVRLYASVLPTDQFLLSVGTSSPLRGWSRDTVPTLQRVGAAMPLRSCSTVVGTVWVACSSSEPQGRCLQPSVDISRLLRPAVCAPLEMSRGRGILLDSHASWPLLSGCALTAVTLSKGLITPLVCQVVISPDGAGEERLGGVPKHTHVVCQPNGFSSRH